MKTTFMRRNFTSDRELVDLLFVNDTEAFEELYHRYWNILYRYSYSKLKSTDDAKRIVRNIFVSLWNERTKLPVNFSLASYLYTAVRNEVVKCIKQKTQDKEEHNFIQSQIIPGFRSSELLKAKQKASVPGKYLQQENYRAIKMQGNIREPLWSKYHSPKGFAELKHALQTMLNLF